MARIIRPDSPARARASLVGAVREALSDLGSLAALEDLRDRLAFAGLALRELERSTERTIDAWERRGYWLKADQFRRDWGWVGQGAAGVLEPLLDGDAEAARSAAKAILLRLPEPDASTRPPRKQNASRWEGAYERLKADPRPARSP